MKVNLEIQTTSYTFSACAVLLARQLAKSVPLIQNDNWMANTNVLHIYFLKRGPDRAIVHIKYY